MPPRGRALLPPLGAGLGAHEGGLGGGMAAAKSLDNCHCERSDAIPTVLERALGAACLLFHKQAHLSIGRPERHNDEPTH